MKEVSDEHIISFVYSLSVEGIKEEWLVSADHDKWYNHIQALPDKLKDTYVIAILNTQVVNGGFNQYFVNGYGQFVFDAIMTLKKIGAEEAANILVEVTSVVNIENRDKDEFRTAILKGTLERLYSDDELEMLLEDMDDKYYEQVQSVESLLAKYLRT